MRLPTPTPIFLFSFLIFTPSTPYQATEVMEAILLWVHRPCLRHPLAPQVR